MGHGKERDGHSVITTRLLSYHPRLVSLSYPYSLLSTRFSYLLTSSSLGCLYCKILLNTINILIITILITKIYPLCMVYTEDFTYDVSLLGIYCLGTKWMT